MLIALSLRRLWVTYKQTAMHSGAGKLELAIAHDASTAALEAV